MGFSLGISKEDAKKALGTDFTPLAAGTYGSVIVEAVVKDSKKGNKMYELNHRIVGGPEGVGRKIKSWHVLVGDGSFSTHNLLKALGEPYIGKDTTDEEIENFEFPDGDELVGRELNIKIKQEAFQGLDDDDKPITRYRNNVGGTFPPDEAKWSDPDEGGEGGSSAPTGNLL